MGDRLHKSEVMASTVQFEASNAMENISLVRKLLTNANQLVSTTTHRGLLSLPGQILKLSIWRSVESLKRQAAPDFTLPSLDDEYSSLYDFRGSKLVLVLCVASLD